MRRSHAALRVPDKTGVTVEQFNAENTIVMRRAAASTEALVVLHFAGDTVNVSLPGGAWENALSSRTQSRSTVEGSLELEPWGCAVLTRGTNR